MYLEEGQSPQDWTKTVRESTAISHWLTAADVDAPLSSNQHAIEIPFQRWFKFKEAFSPQLVADCLAKLPNRPRVVLDAFGGCGTTGLTCQFLGIEPTLFEVNPFIADLAEAKLCHYGDLDALKRDFKMVRRGAQTCRIREPLNYFRDAPLTLCEPGIGDRWLFPKDTLARIVGYRRAIEALTNPKHRRLFRVLLGSVLVPCSNVLVNGKGRRYRSDWECNQSTPDDADSWFADAFHSALVDLLRFDARAESRFQLLRGSCLDKIHNVSKLDAAIFSPPYPNSFDYTDIYNIELWVLGYISKWNENRKLRQATLQSHVQIEFERKLDVPSTPILNRVMSLLRDQRKDLWNRRLPEMVSGYFADLSSLLKEIHSRLTPRGGVFMVVGDSKYGDTVVPVASILAEIAETHGYATNAVDHLRKMRASAQSGGDHQLNESLVWLEKPAH